MKIKITSTMFKFIHDSTYFISIVAAVLYILLTIAQASRPGSVPPHFLSCLLFVCIVILAFHAGIWVALRFVVSTWESGA